MKRIARKVWKNTCIVIVLTVTFFSCANHTEDSSQNVLAEIKDLQVTEDHFRSAFHKYYLQSGQSLQPSLSNKQSVLESEFNTYVMATYAMDLDIHETAEARRYKEMINRRVLNEEFTKRVILEDVKAEEEEIREIFRRFNTTIRASHLYTKNKKEADSLYNLLQQGIPFEDIASNIFQNPALANNGGDLGTFTVDEMDVAFEEAAFSLQVGDISKPVRTAQGYSIIQVTDKFTKPVLTEYAYATKRPQVAYFAEKQKKELATRAHMYAFMDGIDINQLNAEDLYQSLQYAFQNFITDSELQQSFLVSGDETIARYNNFELSVDEFRKELMLTPESNLNRVNSYDSFLNLIKGIAYRTYLFNKAKKEGIHEIQEVQASISQTYYTYLARQADNQLRTSITIDEDELRSTYIKEKERFIIPAEINVSRIVLATEKDANEVHEKLINGADFTTMVHEHTIRNEERLRDGKLGFDYLPNFGILSRDLGRLSEGEISKPLFYQNGEYHIYKMVEMRPETLLSFKEAKPFVKEYLIEKKLKELRAETIERVKEEHDAVVDVEKLKKLTIQI